MRDHLMGYAPLAALIAEGMPAAPTRRTPARVRRHPELEALDRVVDMRWAEQADEHLREKAERAVAPSHDVQPASGHVFKVGDRVRMHYTSGMIGTGVIAAPSISFVGEWHVRADAPHIHGIFRPDQLEGLPAQREQVAEPMGRQHEQPEKAKTAAPVGEWHSGPPKEPGWYMCRSGARDGVYLRAWDGTGWSVYIDSDELQHKKRYSLFASCESDIQWLRKATPEEIGE